MPPLPLIPLLLGLLILASGAWTARADTFQVPSDRFQTIQAAVDEAEDDDIIVIAPGVYRENVLIMGKILTIQSASGDPADTVLEAVVDDNDTPEDPHDDELGDVVEVRRFSRTLPSGEIVIPSRVVLQGLTVRNGDSGVLVRPDSQVEFLDGRVVGNSDGFELEGGSDLAKGFASGIVRHSVLAENSDDGVDVDGRAQLQIEDSMIHDNEDDGIEIRLHDNEFGLGERIQHLIRGNRFLRNGEDGVQLIDYPAVTPRSFRIERNVFAENEDAGLGIICTVVGVDNSIETFEGCPIPEPIELVHNTFVGNDHGLTGAANLIGVGNLFDGNTTLGAKNVAGNSLLAFSLFHGTEDENSNLDITSTLFDDPLLTAELRLSAGSPAVDAGTTFFALNGLTILSLGPGDYRGAAPDVGAFELDTGEPPTTTTTTTTSTTVPTTTTTSTTSTTAPTTTTTTNPTTSTTAPTTTTTTSTTLPTTTSTSTTSTTAPTTTTTTSTTVPTTTTTSTTSTTQPPTTTTSSTTATSSSTTTTLPGLSTTTLPGLSGQYSFIDSVGGVNDADNQSFANIDTASDQFCLAGLVQGIDSAAVPELQVSFDYRSLGSITKANDKKVNGDFAQVELTLSITELTSPPNSVFSQTITTGCTLKGRLQKAADADRVRLKCDVGENFSAFTMLTPNDLANVADAFPNQKHIKIDTEKGKIRIVQNGVPAAEGVVSLTCSLVP